MLVIGENKDGYILSISNSEMANLLGSYSEYEDGGRPKVGEDINISGMYRFLYELSHHKREIEKQRKELLSMAEKLIYPLPFEVGEE